jgi:hypothetical protein
MEIWKACSGFEEIMQVSNHSRVKVLERTSPCIRNGKEIIQIRPEKIISQCIAINGYPEVAVVIGKKRKKFRVHRLVAREFVLGYEENLTVNHIDGNKLNNLPSNLEWVTLSKNSKLEWETGLVDLRGDNNPSRKLSSGKVRIIRELLALGATPNSLSVLLDLCPKTIYLIRDGKRWTELD